MTPGPRTYAPNTLKKLFGLSGLECYNPDCNNKLIAKDGETQISKITHIEGASENGPRYNSDMTDDDRRHCSNLILSCDECHSIIDNPENIDKYPVELLKEWKKNHEDEIKFLHLKEPSLFKIAIDAIAKLNLSELEPPKEGEAFKISNKISYNSVKRNKPMIEEYKIYYSKINTLYEELEKQGSFKKDKLLRNIRNIYVKIKGNYVQDSENEMEIIKNNADNIIDDVQNELFNLLSKDVKENIYFEVSVILVDAFMRCKILEKPPKNDSK
jgi:hypothetical protein